MVRVVTPALEALPPQSVDSEQSVLGGLLLDNGAWDRVADLITERDFYRADHRTIFQHIAQLIENNEPADALTVAESLERSGKLNDVGGRSYLGTLALNTMSAANIRRYAEIVRERSASRQIAGIAVELRDAAVAPGSTPDAIRTDAIAKLSSLKYLTRRPTPLNLRELATREPPERVWAMVFWLAFGHSHLLIGPGGIGKSTLALQMAACLALGRDFIDVIGRPLRVLMWACEDDADEIWRRTVAIARWLDVRLDTLADNLVIVPRLGLENVLVTSEFGRLIFTPSLGELRAFANDIGADVVILDNLAHVYGADENKRHDVTTFLNALAGALPGKTLLLLGHPSRAPGSEFSGSSAWENACRARFYLDRHLPDQKNEGDADDEGIRYLARRKANYSARDWRRFTMKNGVLVPDEVEAGGGLIDGLRKKKAERVILDGLQQLASMGVRAVDGTSSPAFLPRVLLEYRLAEGCSKPELAAAMREQMVSGRIVRAVVGRYSNRSPMEGLKVAEVGG